MTGRPQLRKLAPHDNAATLLGSRVGPDEPFAVCRQDTGDPLA